MKKEIRRIVFSTLTALSFGALGVGTTFALFTSQSKTKINIESGIVDVDQTLSIVSVSELGDVAVTADASGVYTNSIGGKTYVDQETGALKLEKWVPGDKAVITLASKNESNVSIKTRFAESHTSTSDPDLYDALKITYAFAAGYSSEIVESNYKEWTLLSVPTTDNHVISTLTITIELPDSHNGETTYGEDNLDNQYQDTNCAIMFAQEAVQGNAYAPSSLDLINDILDGSSKKNPTMYDALQEASLTSAEAIKRGYVWDSEEDSFEYEAFVTPSHRYFKAYADAMPSTQTFSVYAHQWANAGTVNLDGIGFDAGDVTGFTAINYSNTSGSARTVIIRSNDGLLTVNAENDTVKHYNYANLLTIYAVAGNSYHEYGSVGQAELQAGRLVVEEGGYIGKLTDSGEGEKEIVVNGLVLEVETETEVTGEGTYEEHINEDESVIKVYNFDQFQGLANMCNEGTTFKGLTIQLQNDIDFAGKVWEPFGRYAYRDGYDGDIIVLRDSRFFMGTLDGNNHKILNFSNVGYVPTEFNYAGEEDNPVRADMNYGIIALATGDVTVKDLSVNYAFEQVVGQNFEGVGLIAQYMPMELEPIAKVSWINNQWETSDSEGFDREHMTYELKTATVTLSNIKTSGEVLGKDGVAPLIGYNYGSRHPQTVNEDGVYEWRSLKWASQCKGFRSSGNHSEGRSRVEDFAKAGQGWYAEPFLVQGSNPELTLTVNGQPVSVAGGNCLGYAPVRATYVIDHCENSANAHATSRRAGIIFGKLSNIGSFSIPNFIQVTITATTNSGNASAPQRVGILTGFLGGNGEDLVVDYSGLTNTGTAIVGENVYSGEDAILPHNS